VTEEGKHTVLGPLIFTTTAAQPPVQRRTIQLGDIEAAPLAVIAFRAHVDASRSVMVIVLSRRISLKFHAHLVIWELLNNSLKFRLLLELLWRKRHELAGLHLFSHHLSKFDFDFRSLDKPLGGQANGLSRLTIETRVLIRVFQSLDDIEQVIAKISYVAHEIFSQGA
jgi:hypothetical protein